MRMFFCVILTVLVVRESFSQSDLEIIKEKWKRKEYLQVIDCGTKLRNKIQGKAIPALDYMILTSICMISPNRANACTEVGRLLSDYYNGLPKHDYKLMEESFISICLENGEPNFLILDKLLPNHNAHVTRSSSVSARFKTYALINDGINRSYYERISTSEIKKIVEGITISGDSLQELNDELINTYTKRRIYKNDYKSTKTALSRFGDSCRYWLSQNFLVVTSHWNTIDPKTVANNMEKVLSFFKKAYVLNSPDEYIVVYLVQNYSDINSSIQKVYSTNLSFTPLGYSNIYDNSMLAWVPDGSRIGTLKHELIHLLIQSNFNFIPEWFEEGLASLYEESNFDTLEVLQAKKNWRGYLLNRPPFKYTLNDLFKNKKVNFDNPELSSLKNKYINAIRNYSNRDEDLQRTYRRDRNVLDTVLSVFLTNRVALYKDALSRYFLLYLQDKKMLSEMYQELLHRDRYALNVTNFRTLEEVILCVTRKSSFDELQSDFSNWLDYYNQP